MLHCLEKELLEKLKSQHIYWENKLTEELPENNFPYDYVNNEDEKFSFDSLIIDKDFSEKLKKISGRSNQRLYMIIMSCVYVLIYKYNKNNNLLIGAPIFKQENEGNYINTALPIKCSINNMQSFKELLIEVRDNLIEAHENGNYPISKVIDHIKNDKSIASMNLFDVMVSLEDTCVENISSDIKYNIKFDFKTEKENITAKIKYNTSLYSADTIKRLCQQFLSIVRIVTEDPEVKVKDISLISDEDRSLILNKFNNTSRPYPNEKTISDLFREIVKSNPEKTAIVSNGNEITYWELDKKSNKIANLLIKKGVKRNDILGVLCDKSIECIEAILGIIKAGAAYLPIDLEYPKERVSYMLEDSSSKFLLLDKKLSDNKILKDLDIELIYTNSDEVLCESESDASIEESSEDLVYIIYTSGSTGKPKGVSVIQKNVVRLVKNTNFIEFKDTDRILQTGSIAFDASTFEVWGALLNGLTVYIESKNIILDSETIKECIDKNNITVMWLTAPLFNQLVKENEKIFNNLRFLITGGDVVSPKYVSKALKANPNLVIANGYGPTENTTFSTVYLMKGSWCEDKAIPIGTPIANSTAYVLDEDRNLLPIGMPGELYVGGDGVARGYLNREKLTAERFIDSPFKKGERLYKTGDQVKQSIDGNISFLGRIDYQVKIRGFRIELEEVKKHLLKNASVKECVVLDKVDEDGNKFLAAYLCGDESLSISDIREYLKNNVPNYMIPSTFTILDKMPLNSNGKFDIKKLRDMKDEKEEVSCTKARNNTEKILIDIWAEVLGKSMVGIDNDFFSLGGDSIKVIQILSRLRKYNLKLNVQDFFKYPTIRVLSSHVKNISENTDQEMVVGEAGLTPVQSWFFQESKSEINHFNHSVMLYKENGFNEKILRDVCKKLIEHHDALRMTYKLKQQSIVGIFNDLKDSDFSFKIFDLKQQDDGEKIIDEETMKIQKSMDIKNGPLIKFALFKQNKGDKFLIVIHHLVVDGISWRILLDDLAVGYVQALKGEKIEFAKKTTSFKEWSNALYKYADSEKIRREIKYWDKYEEKDLKQLPKKMEAVSDMRKDSKTITVKLNSILSRDLLEKTNKAFNTEINDILLSALEMAANKWVGDGHIYINLEGHGREEVAEDINISSTIGWFTSIYPVLLKLENYKNIGSVIKDVKETLRRVPNKGIGYGILKYITSKEDKSLKKYNYDYNPEISFNYMGEFENHNNKEVFDIDTFLLESSVSTKSDRHNAIDIVGIMRNKEINFMFNYNIEEFDEEVINTFANDYVDNLAEIVEFCRNRKETELTPSDLGDRTLTFKELDMLKEKYGLNIEKVYQLTPLQEGMLFHSIMEKNSGSYVVQSVLGIKGDFSKEIFEKCFNEVIKKYEIFRSAIVYEEIDKPRQVVLKERKIDCYYKDLSMQDNGEIDNYLNDDRKLGFKLEDDTLMRIAIFKISNENYKIIWTFHHIVLDGWCLGIVLNDIFDFYEKISCKKSLDYKIEDNFGEYVKWVEDKDKGEAEAYWKNYLEDFDKQSRFSEYKKEAAEEGYKPQDIKLVIDKDNTDLLTKITKENQITMSNIIQAAWGILMQKYCNVDDVAFGAVVSGRSSEVEGIENTVGLFINTLPIRVKTKSNMLFSEVVEDVQKHGINNEKFSYYPLSKIQSFTKDKRDIFDTIIAFENYPLDINKLNEEVDNVGLEIVEAKSIEQTNYNFDIVVIPGDKLEITFSYNSNAYERDFVERVSYDMRKILNIIIENYNICIEDINLLKAEEKQKIIGAYGIDIDEKWRKESKEQLVLDEVDFDF